MLQAYSGPAGHLPMIMPVRREVKCHAIAPGWIVVGHIRGIKLPGVGKVCINRDIIAMAFPVAWHWQLQLTATRETPQELSACYVASLSLGRLALAQA